MRRSGGGAAFVFDNAEAETLVAAMNVAPNDTRKGLIDDLVGGLKTDGIWAELDILYLTAAHDSQAAQLNWKDPGTFDLIAVNSPTFETDRGYTGNGSTSRLRTQFTPSTNAINMAQDDASCWVWVTTDVSNANSDLGSLAGTGDFRICTRNGNNVQIAISDDTISGSGAPANSIGFTGASRAVSTTKKGWRNGVQSGTDIAVTSTGLAPDEQWVCGANSTQFSPRQIAAAAWGASLAGLEDEFYARMLTYMQGVGAAA